MTGPDLSLHQTFGTKKTSYGNKHDPQRGKNS
jgi:hypothetical protein